MANLFKLNYSQQTFSFSRPVKLYRVNLQDDSLQFHALHDRRLHSYQYHDNTWQTFFVEDFDAQQLFFSDVQWNGKDILITKTEKGIHFYQRQKNALNLLAKSDDFKENEFHDVYGWGKSENIVKFGHFYNDTNLVGILTKHQEYGIKFYAVIKNELFAGKYPIWPLKTDLSILDNSSQAKFFLVDLKRKGQQNIIVYGRAGLNIYEFNKLNMLEHLMQIPNSAKLDYSEVKLFFPNLTGQSYQDIVLINSSGLFVYQYNNEQNNYSFIHYSPMFTKLKGWNAEHVNSVQFEDIDLDGRQDMFFTGPQGINLLSFNNYTNQWQALLDNSQLAIPERHGDIMKVMPAYPPVTKHPIAFTQYKNQLRWANVVEIDESLEEEIEPQTVDETSPQILASPIIPQLLQLPLEEEKPVLFLRDQLDCSSIIDAVDKGTGKPRFKLPLIDLSNFSTDLKLNFFYDGNSQVSGTLGLGWTLPQNFIMMDYQSSIFPEDEKYYIVAQDLPQQLIFDSRNSTGTVDSFKLSNQQPDLHIYHHKNEEKWEIHSSGFRQIYGRIKNEATESIIWELTWKNWRGVGSSPTGQKHLATAWYLAEVRDENNNAMRYTYDTVNIPVSNGKRFTREIYLKSISDDKGNVITLNYSDKDRSEYTIPPLVDKEGNLNMNQVQTRYLSGCMLTTQSYRQNINFIYKVENGKRFLTKINQEDDITNQPILRFAYKNMSKSHVLEKAILPTGANIEFEYQLLGAVSPITEEKGRRCDVQTNYRVDYGSDDVLVSYIDQQGQVALRMFNQEMTEEICSSVASSALSRFPLLGRGSVKEYEVRRTEDFLAVVLYYHSDREVFLLRKEEGKWLSTPKYYNFNEDAIIRFGKDFMVVADVKFSLQLFSWNKDSKEWRENIHSEVLGTNKEPLLLEAFGRGFITYDNDRLWIGYKNHKHQWQYNPVKVIPGLIDDIKTTIGKFDLTTELHKSLLSFFKNTALQVNNNLISLNRWKVEGTKLYSVIDLFVLDGSYKVAKHQTHKVLQDDLNQFSREIEDRDKNFFTLGYKEIDNNFKVIVKDFRGPILDDIYKETDNRNKINIAKDEVRESVIKSMEKVFLLDYKKYFAVLNSQTVICNTKKFTFLGDEWKVDNVSETPLKWKKFSIPLSNKFVLHKEDLKSSLKIYKQGNEQEKMGNSLLDLEVKQLNQTLVRYPVYLAYQQTDGQAVVVEFANGSSLDKPYKLSRAEQISPFSSYQTLVTSVDRFDSGNSKTLIFRQMLDIRRLLPNPVITKITVSFDNGSKRITAYEYSGAKALGNTVYYENTSIILGGDKRSFGWVEETQDFGNRSRAEKKIFNSQGRLIKTFELKNEQINGSNTISDKENLHLNPTLDTTGQLEVANFSPYEIADEESGYYGFENYEINRIGTKNSTFEKKWLFNETNVVKQKFSFTGQNYLSLSEQTLEGTFRPNNQSQEYVASCWVRPQSKMFELGAVTPYLKAIVYSESGDEIYVSLGEVKFQSSDWFYLEVGVDLLRANQIIVAFNERNANSTLKEQPNLKLKTSIFIGSRVNTTIDIDHVRFSSLNSDFQANVYDPKTKQVREVIHASGLVNRYVYDNYGEQVASINEYGQLEEFNIYTKTSSIGRITEPNSRIQIQPESGFYEDFAPYAFYLRFKIDNADSWQISPRQLQHLTNDSHDLQINPYEISSVSHGMRLCFSLQSDRSIIKFNNNLMVMSTNDGGYIVFAGKRQTIPLDGEILIVVEHSHLFVWVDGGLYVDSFSNGSLFNLRISGKAKIRDLMVFSEPSIQVTYLNALAEKLQEIVLEGERTVIVREYLYDELGRQSITTQFVKMERSNSQSILAYYPNFVTNSSPYSVSSVWKTGRLEGDISRAGGEYSYIQTKYNNNPLDEKCAVGLPGREFSVSGSYAKRFDSVSDNLFINNMFPNSQHYSYQVEHKPGGVEDISVFDNKNNRVAWYVHVPGSKDLLSTYEYDDNDRLVKSLPPLYHEKVRTFHKINSQLRFLSVEEKALQKSLGIHISYDKRGNLVTITTPDSGKIENLYDKDGLLKFVVHYSNLNNTNIDNVVYFNYDHRDRLSSTGKLTSLPTKEELLTLTLSAKNTQEYQQFYHSDSEHDPLLRGKLKRTITFNDGEPLIEESILNIDKETLSKRITIPIKGDDTPLVVAINKRYVARKLRQIEYPIVVQGQPFRLTYQYNKLGKVIGIGVPGKHNLFVNLTYNTAGLVSSEQHLPESGKNFTRHYSYNSPGFLTGLEDKFLTERVFYTSGSYGGRGYGDGTVTRTEFKATWHEYCDDSELGLNEQSFISKSITLEESALCFRKLKEAGYLNEFNHQAKVYYPSLETKLPIICSYGLTGRQIENTLGKEGFPTQYGHSYDYGNHQELTKAKYFVGTETTFPLQPDTFANSISGINSTASRDIWQILKSSGHLVENNDKIDLFLGHAKRGKSFIRSTLFSDLKNVHADYVGYKLPLERFLVTHFSPGQNLSPLKLNLEDAFIEWNGGIRTERIQQATKRIIEMLEIRQYLQNPLSEEFKNILKNYQSFIPKIVGVLSGYFAKQLGEAEFDVESYDIDANGNHKFYYTGFDSYELNYRNNTNQVNNLKFRSYASSKPEHSFSIKHDNRGNVVQALHKGIQQIDYDLVSNRATKIQLTDGKTLTFYYDAQGERVLKRVANSQGQRTTEIQYIRDEFGRALVETEITYISQDLPPDVLVTAYIYGPRGLLGFIRRDEFYSVITDHEGSIRLVVKGDEVVAAYDYLPYGNLMREYGSDPEAHVSYRYTGQEWDAEVGLYNFHARFYDPSIGRFYQIDPKAQYFSPYKYAGNSPVSIVDPDGEFAFLIPLIILGLTAGAYLGGSAANQNFNPIKWDYKKGKTWLGIVGGGFGGALLPVAFAGSVGAFTAMGLSSGMAIAATTTLGVGGVYLSASSTNKQWDPSKWDFSSTETWNAIFEGFAIGSGIAGGIKTAATFYKDLSSTLGKGAFISGSTATGGGLFVMNGYAANWEFSEAGVYFGFVDAITGAPDLHMFVRGAFRFLSKNGRYASKYINDSTAVAFKRIGGYYGGTIFNNVHKSGVISLHFFLNRMRSKRNLFNTFMFIRDFGRIPSFQSLGNIVGGVTASATLAALMASAATEGKWDMTSFTTYHALINGMLTGGQLSSIGRSVHRRHTTINKIKPDEHARQAVGEVIDLYGKFVEEAGISYDPTAVQKFSNRVTQQLEKGKIPHTAVAIAITADEKAFVGFSGNSGPGLLVAINLRQKTKSVLFLNDNSLIGGSKIALEDQIMKAITDKDDKLKKYNIEEFVEKNKKLKSFLSEKLVEITSLTKYEINNIIANFLNEIREKGFIKDVDRAKQILQRPLTEKYNKLKVVSGFEKRLKYLKHNQENIIKDLETKISQLEQELGLGKKASLSKEMQWKKKIDTLDDRIGELKQIKEQILKDINFIKRTINDRGQSPSTSTDDRSLIDMLWEDHLKQMHDQFTHWEPTNCAEPHAINAALKSSQIFDQHKNSKNNLKDIRYLATYKIKYTDGSSASDRSHFSSEYTNNLPQIPLNEPTISYNDGVPLNKHPIMKNPPALLKFPRCDNCLITTQSVKYVLTDPYWSKTIDDLKSKLPSLVRKHDLDKERLYFLLPYHYMTNRLSRVNVTDSKKGTFSSRQRRSQIDERPRIEVIPINRNNKYHSNSTVDIVDTLDNNHATNVINQIKNSAARPSSWINDLLGWVKGSIVGLLNSKSVESEKGANISQQIDVNSTLMLLDLLIRKITGQNYVSSVENSISLLEAQGYALNITKGFEKVVEQAANDSKISIHRLDIDCLKVQDAVTKKIIGGKFNEISGVLSSHIEKACPCGERGRPGKLSPKKFDKFMATFNYKLNTILYQSIPQILDNEYNTLVVNSIKDQQRNFENKKLRSYLDNISVSAHLTQGKCLE